MKRAALILLSGCLCGWNGAGWAEDGVRYYEHNGVTYRETRRVERRPVTATEWQQQERTVYRDQYVTELQDRQRTVLTPVTEYRVEPRWHNWWNPFGRPYVAYHVKPETRWEARVETYQAPVTYRQVVPQTQVVQVPQRVLQFEEREVTERVALEPVQPVRQLATRPTPPAARTAHVGGIRRVDNDPPRHGIAPLDLSQPTRR